MNKDYSKYFDKILSLLNCLKGANIDYTPLLESIQDLLVKIDENTDELEITAENISLNADQINLNTDEVEQLLEDIKVLVTPTAFENKSYQIDGGKTITFAANSVYRWEAGVYDGMASYTEGGGIIGKYKIGESFGNGDLNNKTLNVNPIAITTDPNPSEVRISVLQVVGYTPTII
jgi:hypothetical protein